MSKYQYKRIYIFLNNNGFADLNLLDFAKFNPGIGGSEYMILLLYYNLLNYYGDDYVYLLVTRKFSNFPLKSIIIASFESINELNFLNESLLIIRPLKNKFFFSTLKKLKTRIITWGHNFYDYDMCEEISNNPYIIANVFVGDEQLNRYRDHRIYSKSITVYNFTSKSSIYKKTSFRDKQFIDITYIGSLIPDKGFHLLAKIWKRLTKNFNNLRLNVIGSGSLYSRESTLGVYKIAEPVYESKLIELLGNNGIIPENIIFHGNLGKEKEYIFNLTDIGVVNPSGKTETFGLGAVEMQSYGIPIVTKRINGHLDTIKHCHSGYLFTFNFGFYFYLTKLIKNNKKRTSFGNNAISFVHSKFDNSKIFGEWINLIENQKLELKNTKFINLSLLNKIIFFNYTLRFKLRINFLKPFVYYKGIFKWKKNI